MKQRPYPRWIMIHGRRGTIFWLHPPHGRDSILRFRWKLPNAYCSNPRGAIRVTDCITQRQFRKTPHYVETLRPIDIHYQIVMTLDIPGTIAGMTVNRDKNFTDKEAMLLHLVAPQIALAHRNAQAFTALKRATARMIPTPEELRQVGVTARESEVLHWLIQGKRDAEIGAILSASPRTIHNHVRSILRKLNTETRTAASLEAIHQLKKGKTESGVSS
jgi:DNA-binding CsgD family transcriptional regulator